MMMMMMNNTETDQLSEEEETEEVEYDDEHLSLEEESETLMRNKKNNKKNKNYKSKNKKKRFSDEQVRSLETIFESETKLEPRKKIQVATELGLQPRQVAIWFQNKRARWKSKQIEKSYRILKANYDSLKTRFDAIRKDKEALLRQLQELRSLVEKSHTHEGGGGGSSKEDFVPNSQSFSQAILHSDDDNNYKISGNMAYLRGTDHDHPQLLNLSHENIDSCNISQVKWCNFNAGSIFDQSSSSSHWWDSWT